MVKFVVEVSNFLIINFRNFNVLCAFCNSICLRNLNSVELLLPVDDLLLLLARSVKCYCYDLIVEFLDIHRFGKFENESTFF